VVFEFVFGDELIELDKYGKKKLTTSGQCVKAQTYSECMLLVGTKAEHFAILVGFRSKRLLADGHWVN
jgi:hypothetical protein